MIYKVIYHLMVLAAFVGCSPGPVTQIMDLENKSYKRDVKIAFEGKTYHGVAVLPKRDKYDLEFTFAGKVDLFTFRTCHRELTQEDAGGGRIFGKNNKVSFTYVPVQGIEDHYCPVEVAGFEKDKGRHSQAFLDFQTPLEAANAVVLCNGSRIGYDGVSVCQTLAGLITKIIFTHPTSVKSADGCADPFSTDSKSFTILQSPGRCVYSFKEKTGTKDFHRLSTIGYQDITIRSVE
jgi:hypothetical protein